MNVLRWILFLPVGFVCTGIAQLIVMGIATAMNAFIAFWIVLVFNIINYFAGAIPMMVAPKPKIALWIFLPLFLVFEYIGFTKTGAPPMTTMQTVCRILGDLGLIAGMVGWTFTDHTKQ